MTEKKKQRVLVIDDDSSRIFGSVRLFGARARNIQVIGRYGEVSEAKEEATERALDYSKSLNSEISIEAGREEEIEEALRGETYAAILLDGNLGLDLEGEYFDGKVIARKLRSGEYGSPNQQTRILSTSSSYGVIPQAEDLFRLDFRNEIPQHSKDLAQELFEE
jgi:hypothetical protein